MTAIVGLVHNGVVHMGGDSAAPQGWDLTVRSDPKVFRNGAYLFGFTTSWRMGQLLRFNLKPTPPSGDTFQFVATHLIDAVRDCLKEGGWSRKTNEEEQGGEFMIGVAGRLFKVHSDYQVAESVDPYNAVGCGGAAALGALYATSWTKMTPKRRVLLALEAAERLSAGVRGPFTCLSIGRAS